MSVEGLLFREAVALWGRPPTPWDPAGSCRVSCLGPTGQCFAAKAAAGSPRPHSCPMNIYTSRRSEKPFQAVKYLIQVIKSISLAWKYLDRENVLDE